MKNQVLSVAWSASLLLALTIVPAYPGTSARVVSTIPFEFTAAGKTVPAGVYTILQTDMPNILLIKSAWHPVTFVSTLCPASDKDLAKARLVFRRYGDRYFLALVSFGAEGGYVMKVSRAERDLLNGNSNSLAKNVLKPELIYIDAQ